MNKTSLLSLFILLIAPNYNLHPMYDNDSSYSDCDYSSNDEIYPIDESSPIINLFDSDSDDDHDLSSYPNDYYQWKTQEHEEFMYNASVGIFEYLNYNLEEWNTKYIVGYLEATKKFIKHLLTLAAQGKISEQNIKNKYLPELICCAASDPISIPALDYLLKLGAHPHNNLSPLIFNNLSPALVAAATNNSTAINLLQEHSNIIVDNSDIRVDDSDIINLENLFAENNSETPLNLAVERGCLKTVVTLLNKDVDINLEALAQAQKEYEKSKDPKEKIKRLMIIKLLKIAKKSVSAAIEAAKKTEINNFDHLISFIKDHKYAFTTMASMISLYLMNKIGIGTAIGFDLKTGYIGCGLALGQGQLEWVISNKPYAFNIINLFKKLL